MSDENVVINRCFASHGAVTIPRRLNRNISHDS